MKLTVLCCCYFKPDETDVAVFVDKKPLEVSAAEALTAFARAASAMECY